MYCFDTDVLSALARRHPPTELVRRLSQLPSEDQSTTSITIGEMIYGISRRKDRRLQERVRAVLDAPKTIHAFDAAAAEVYGPLRARLEEQGRRLDEPDLRIASIVLANDLTLVTGNVRHFARVPDLRVENWLET